MPDITMCKNEQCIIKNDCYRYTAKPDRIQSYAMFIPVGGKCDYFWENEKTYKNIQKGT